MAYDGHGWCFGKEELYYTDYFDRCRSVGMTANEISNNLYFLDKYYQKDVINKLSDIDLFWNKYTSVKKIFIDWCENNNLK